MPTRIHFVVDHAQIEGLAHWHGIYSKELESQQCADVTMTNNPEEATYMLFLEAGRSPARFWDRNFLLEHPLVRRYPEKCRLWCSSDNPAAYLPGLFVSMPRKFFDRRLHRAFRYFKMHNERNPIPQIKKRDLLYNFVGAPTSAVRERLLAHQAPEDALVRETLNYNHSRWANDEVVTDYTQILTRSRFTLCPRGVGTSSYRLFETMRVGSVPVIFSDELVLPEGPDWTACSVRIAEKDAHKTESILREIKNAEEMGQAAAKAFQQFFSEERLLINVARELEALGPTDLKLAKKKFRKQELGKLKERALRKLGFVISKIGKRNSERRQNF